MVLTWGCKYGTEVEECERGRTGAAFTGIPCGDGGRRVEPRAWSCGVNVTITGAAVAAGTVDSGDVNGLGK